MFGEKQFIKIKRSLILTVLTPRENFSRSFIKSYYSSQIQVSQTNIMLQRINKMGSYSSVQNSEVAKPIRVS